MCCALEAFFQPLSKYVTRFALGLSTTIPVLEFQEKNMFLIDDICELSYFLSRVVSDLELKMVTITRGVVHLQKRQ